MITHLISHPDLWFAYSLVMLPIWRFLAGYYAHKSPHYSNQLNAWGDKLANGYKKGDPNWAWGFWGGLSTVLFWPLVITGIVVFQLLNHWPSLLKSGPERQYVATQEKQRLAEKVKRLEQEAGL